jgi:nitrite reductase/ring-hydroxylating ferredoxin subunit
MAETARLICSSIDLAEGGKGVRFEHEAGGVMLPAFAIRHGGRVHAYINRCAHVGVELDWTPGEFFDDSGLYLICATHGAMYLPESGRCIAGPCRGASLTPLIVFEQAGSVYLK